DVRASTTSPGEWVVFGTDQFGLPVIAGYSASVSKFLLLNPGDIIDQAFVFDFTGPDSVTGCHYQYPPGQVNLDRCHNMTGTRPRPNPLILDLANADEGALQTKGSKQAEGMRYRGGMGAAEAAAIVDALQRLRRGEPSNNRR